MCVNDLGLGVVETVAFRITFFQLANLYPNTVGWLYNLPADGGPGPLRYEYGSLAGPVASVAVMKQFCVCAAW